jgi:hypothetical protein
MASRGGHREFSTVVADAAAALVLRRRRCRNEHVNAPRPDCVDAPFLESLLLCGSLDKDPQFREGQRQIDEFEYVGDRAQALVSRRRCRRRLPEHRRAGRCVVPF